MKHTLDYIGVDGGGGGAAGGAASMMDGSWVPVVPQGAKLTCWATGLGWAKRTGLRPMFTV